MALNIGTQAPDFKLYNTTRQEITLSSFRGRNLIMQFFPAAFTRVCTAQMCGSRDELADYNNMNASVIGISTDTPFALAEFKAKNNINFDLLSDSNKETINAYDMVQENFSMGMKNVAKRGVIVIDKNGIIQYTDVPPTPADQINFDALKEAVSKLS